MSDLSQVPTEELVRMLQGFEGKKFEMPAKLQEEARRQADPTSGMSTLEKFTAGFGGAMPNLLRGVGQTLGVVSREDVAEARRLDAPLNRTGAGAFGNFVGTASPLALTSAIPGANTILGATAIGTGIGFMSPSTSTSETVQNTVLGGVLSAGGQLAGQAVGSMMSKAAPVPASGAGYVVPPSQQPGAGAFSRAAEGFAGKVTTAQQASTKNQGVTNQLARTALGISDDAPLNIQTLNNVRREAGKAYEAVKSFGTMQADDVFRQDIQNISSKFTGAEKDFPGLGKSPITDVLDSINQQRFTSAGAVDAIRILRDKADDAISSGSKSMGRAYREAADALEAVVERNIAAKIGFEAGPQDAAAKALLDNYRAARTKIAQTYAVEKALNETTGNVSAVALGRNKKLTGELRTAADFGRAYPKAAQRPEIIGSQPGTSPLDYVGSAILGGAGVGITGDPTGGAAAIIPFLRPAVRAGLLSRPYQSALSSPGLLSRVPGVSGNEALIEEIIRRGSLPIAATSVAR